MKLVWNVVVVAVVFGTVAQAAPSSEAVVSQDVSVPTVMFRLQQLPLLQSISSTIAAERFSHDLSLDTEVFVTNRLSLGVSLSSTNTSVQWNRRNGVLRSDHFVKQFGVGALGTYFITQSTNGGFFGRGRMDFMFADTDQSSRNRVNLSTQSFGSRASLEAGFQLRMDMVTLDFAGGVATYLSKPQREMTSGETDADEGYDLGAGIENAMLGLSSIYPTVRVGLGLAF